MSSNKHCGPDIVKYFVVGPEITGATGDFSVCNGELYVNTILGCVGNVELNGNIFYGDGSVLFNSTIRACDGVYTSNLYGCSPITVHDQLRLNAVNNDNTTTRLLTLNNLTNLVEYRDLSTIITTSGTSVANFSYNNKNTFTITRNDSVEFSATIDVVTGLTINGNLLVTGTTEVGGDIIPTLDNTINIGTPIKRFRNVNTVSGTSTVWTSTDRVITPELNLGLDGLLNQRTITANNSIIQHDVLYGGTF